MFFQVYCYGQNDVTIEWKNDTAWYVNYNYDVAYAPEHVIDMPFPVFNGLNYQSYKVDWGDGDVDLVSSLLSVERKVRHTYVGTGVYCMEITLCANADGAGISTVYYKKIMNRELSANFSLTPPIQSGV